MNRSVHLRNFIFIALCWILGSTYATAQCNWQPMGPDDDMFFMEDSSSLWEPSIASDNNGVQYVAWCDGEHGNKISVKRLVNDHWSFLGLPGFSAGQVDFVKIATDNLNRVYVAYKDLANNARLTVQYYNGVSWSLVGTAGMGNDTIVDMDMTVDKSNNHPVVYFTDSTDISTVMDYNGSTWSTIGSTNFGYPQMYEGHITSHNGTAYLCYHSYNLGQLNVITYNGSAWVPLGNLSPSFVNSGWASAITFDNNNVPYIAFDDNSASGYLSMMYLNAGTWTYLGTPGIIPFQTWYNNVVFDQSNNAYIAYTKPTGTAAEILKYNGSSWSVVSSYATAPNAYITFQWAYYRGVSIDPNTNDLYMLYTENTASPLSGWKNFGVMKFDGTAAHLTGIEGAAGPVNIGVGSSAAYFEFDRNGIPYVTYSDSLQSDKISVKKYVNNQWVFVGTPGFNGGVTEWPKITFDTNNVPYVAFRQGNADVYVMKYNGSAWVYVGAVITGTYNIDIAINPLTNEPHIIYDDVNNGVRGNVARFNGSSWVNVGPANFTLGSCAYPSIRFDHAGNEYVAYSDNSLGIKCLVQKFNGSSWVTVGGTTISAAQAHLTKLVIDAQDNLYVVYQDQSNSYRPLCHTFNGTNWVMLGSFISNGYVSDVDVAVDPGGNLFVYYNEQYLNYYPGTVRRYFNNTWIPVGDQYIFNSTCLSTEIRINPVTGLPSIGSVTRPGVPNSSLSKKFFLKTLPCNFDAALMGQVVYDVNTSCTNDPGEQALSNQPVRLTQASNTDVAFTDGSGQYYFTNSPAGAYTIGMGNLTNGYNVSCSNSLPHATTITTNALTTEIFSIDCTPAFDIRANSFTALGTWWPGQNVRIWSNVSIQNTVCDGPVTPGTIRLIFPPCLTYVLDTTLPWQPSAVSPSASGDTVWYAVADVYNPSPYLYNSILTSAHICNTATLGDSLCIELSVSAAGDANVANNVYNRCVHIATSYDPNVKEVTPRGFGTEGFIPATTGEMVYTIHFQNTGTAPAQNIRIIDTISSNLDYSTMEILASSHYTSNNSLLNGVMTFNFPNIMLPDSSVDMLNSMGYITYKINLMPSLAPLTEIRNTAYIYFDFNSPVVTNGTLNTIQDPNGVDTQSADLSTLVVFPNPATSNITLQATSTMKEIKILNTVGQIVYENRSLNSKQVDLNIEGLSNGVYFIQVGSGDQTRVIKFVKN